MRKGFTLIELLVVVLVIGILTAIALPQYQKTVLKAGVVDAISAARTIASAQQLYYLNHGSYTIKFNDLDITLPGKLVRQEASVQELNIGDNVVAQLVQNASAGIQTNIWSNISGKPTTAGIRVLDFAKGDLYCTAYKNDPQGMAICESFGPQVISPAACNNATWYCYSIKG